MANVNLDQMVDRIAEELQGNEEYPQSVREISKKAIRAVLTAEKEAIKDAVAEGDKVGYIGFGTFEGRERAARKGRNPQTGENIDIAATTAPAFKPGKAFKDAVRG